MNLHHRHFLDFPNEILLLILKKLENIDVLYSLLDINNQRLDILVQEQIFSTILNFVSTSEMNERICSIPKSTLDQLCVSVLPRIHENVQSLIVEPIYMECILRAADYPNLTKLKVFNFNMEFVSLHLIGKIFMYNDRLIDRKC